MEWVYDSHNNYTSSKMYNKLGQLVRSYKYDNKYTKKGKETIIQSKYINGKGYQKQFKSVKEGNTTTTYYYTEKVGYNYNIKLHHAIGSVQVRKNDSEGNLKSLKLYDKNKKLIGSVIVIHKKLK